MITIISGVPGTGKTALILEMAMEELRSGRKVFTIGIPELLLKTHEGGDPLKWQDGTWLEIDSFNPDLCKQKGVKSQWFPRGCPSSCEFLSTCPRFKPANPDAGALLIIDEAHAYFPQRASGKAPPPHVEALNVHRHQGLDIWFVTQRPAFLDPVVRGLCSRHIHIGLSAFVFFGQRIKYEWPEYQESLNRVAKMAAAKVKYRPSSNVYPLYKSATIHTKLEQRMPNIMRAFIVVVLGFVAMVGVAVSRVNDRVQQASGGSSGVIKNASVGQLNSQGVPVQSAGLPASSVVMVPVQKVPEISACISSETKCQCYTAHGVYVDISVEECRLSAIVPTKKFRFDEDQRPSTEVALR